MQARGQRPGDCALPARWARWRAESSFSKVDTLWLVDTALELAGRTIAQRRVQAVAVVEGNVALQR